MKLCVHHFEYLKYTYKKIEILSSFLIFSSIKYNNVICFYNTLCLSSFFHQKNKDIHDLAVG